MSKENSDLIIQQNLASPLEEDQATTDEKEMMMDDDSQPSTE
jgi:hypothetical protein